jgi:copper(I)-binding protein
VNRFNTRLSAAGAGLAASTLVVAVALTGCSAGQVSQTANQESAVNGTSGTVGHVALRNVHLQAVQTADYLQPGQTVELMMLASNGSPDTNDRLVGITSDVGTITVAGDATLPANDVLVVGSPDGQDRTALEAIERANLAKATVALAKPISNGLTYDFTFNFEKAGQTTLAVPISAGSAPRQEAPASEQH